MIHWVTSHLELTLSRPLRTHMFMPLVHTIIKGSGTSPRASSPDFVVPVVVLKTMKNFLNLKAKIHRKGYDLVKIEGMFQRHKETKLKQKKSLQDTGNSNPFGTCFCTQYNGGATQIRKWRIIGIYCCRIPF